MENEIITHTITIAQAASAFAALIGIIISLVLRNLNDRIINISRDMKDAKTDRKELRDKQINTCLAVTELKAKFDDCEKSRDKCFNSNFKKE